MAHTSTNYTNSNKLIRPSFFLESHLLRSVPQQLRYTRLGDVVDTRAFLVVVEIVAEVNIAILSIKFKLAIKLIYI